jgi:RNA polymerase sigma factor (sigma-70 family)
MSRDSSTGGNDRKFLERSCEVLKAIVCGEINAQTPNVADDLVQLRQRLLAIATAKLTRLGSQNPREDAEDAVQETLAKVLMKGKRYSHYEPFAPLPLKVLARECVSIIRAKRHGLVRNAEIDVADPRCNPHRSVEVTEFLKTSLDRVSRNQKQAVTLRHIVGMSAREAGRVAGATPAQINRWAFEGRTKIKEALRRRGLRRTDFLG